MAVPTLVGVGVVAEGIGAITPALPAGTQANDILFCIAESAFGEAYSTPTDWAHVTGSPVSTVAASTVLHVFWKRAVGSDADPAIGDSGDHNIGRCFAIRGVRTSGNPWEAATTGADETVDTSAEFPDVTTLGADRLIVHLLASGADVAPGTMDSPTNAALANLATILNNWTATAGGGGIAVATGEKATAGAVGTTTATVPSNREAMMTLALVPATVAASSGSRMLMGVG